MDGAFVPRDVVVVDGRITEHAPRGSVPWATDLGDVMLVPGFVDLQVNGGFGHDITADPGSLWDVAARLVEHGVTAFCPTLVSGPDEAIDAAVDALARRSAGFVGAEPLGLHLEGPMISPGFRGAHPTDRIRDLDPGTWRAPGVRIATLAPEVAPPGVIESLVAQGVVVSLGHTGADHDTAMAAFDAGASMVTHLFNAMPPFAHREPGVVGAALDDERVFVAVIADGVHLHPTTLRLVHRIVGDGRLVATTDAMAAMGLPPGRSTLGGIEVESDGLAPRLGDGSLAGSVVTMGESVVRLARLAGIGMEAAITAHATTPARLLGDRRRGILEVGARGDLVALDDDGSIVLTVVAGEVVHRA